MTTTSAAASTQVTPTLRVAALRLLLVAGVLGFCANVLFVNQPLGLNFPLFAIWSLAALFALAGLEHIRPAWRNVWLAAPLAFFAAMVAVRAEPWLTFLNVVTVLGLVLLLSYLFASGRIVTFSLWDYVGAGIASSLEVGLLRPGAVLVAAGAEAARPNGGSPLTVAVLRGALIASPILILFTFLLTSADAAFGESVRSVLEFLRLDNLPELIFRLLVTGVATWVCAGGLAYALREPEATSEVKTNSRASRPPLGFTEAAVVLVCVNALFAAFVAVQFRYFFGGQGNITIAGFTYAEYARRGFAELVVVALFTLGLGLLLQTLTRRQSAAVVWSFNALCAVLVTLTGILLASAFQRLLLYEEAYGFTRLRTYPHVFMVWVGVLLVVFLLTTVISRPRLFVFGGLLAALGFLMTLNVLNVDALVARQNIARYHATGKLDAPFLAALSDDATPELLPLLNAKEEDVRAVIGGALHARLNRLEAQAAASGWPGWHWSRAQALALLKGWQPQLERYEPQEYYWRVPLE